MRNSRRLLKVMRRTLLQAIPMALAVVALNFFLVKLAPGDFVDLIAAEAETASMEQIEELRREYGLDRPVHEQFVTYLGNLAQLDLGQSARFNKPVLELILQRLPPTLLLMGTAFTLAVVLGTMLGAVMSTWANRLPDRISAVLSLLLYSTPAFWLGLMLIVLFAVHLRWLPTGGDGPIISTATGFAAVTEKLRYLILPALTLSLHNIAIYARLTRAAMMEVRDQDFVRTAVAKGATPLRVTLNHVLRNALIPLTTVAGMQFASLLSGAVVIETVFSWPGLGRLMFEAVSARDFQVLLGVVLMSTLLVIIVNALVDVAQALIDPRIQAS